MNTLLRVLYIFVGLEVLGASILCGLRLNSTRPSSPAVESYTDAITGAELLALPDRFLFDSAHKWRVLGETYLKTGFLHHATACLSRAAEMDPQSAEIAVVYGFCLDRAGRLEAAQAEFQRATQRGNGPVEEAAWYFLGRTLLQREQPTDAERAFRNAGNNHLPSVFQRARLMLRGERHSEAAPLLQQLVTGLPQEVRVWQLLSQYAESTGARTIDAANIGERTQPLLWIHNLPPNLSVVTEELGMARQFQEALQQQLRGDKRGAAQRMVLLTGDETRWQNSNPWLLQTVAAACLDAGDIAAARKLLERQVYVDLFPTARAWNLLGYAAFLEQHPIEAERFWHRSRSMNPATIDYDKLSFLAEQNGDRTAQRTYEGLRWQYAGINAFRGNALDQAQSNLRRAIEITSDLPTAWFYLGETEQLLGNKGAAEEAYHRCLQLNPNHGRAKTSQLRLCSQ